jgi:ribosomal protein S18 acetylase RimI-like enzyme
MLDGVVEVLNASLTADPVDRSTFVRKVLLDPNFDPEGAPVALVSGEPAGFALAIAPTSEVARGYVTLLGVRPEHRRHGVGSALLRHCEGFLSGRGCRDCRISPYGSGYFTPGVDIRAYAGGLEFLVRRGYEPGSPAISMQCDLSRLARPEWVARRERELAAEGVTFAPYAPQGLPALFRMIRSSFTDDWERYARNAAELIELGDAPSRLWVATSGDEVVGFSHHEAARFGPIGVAPEHRGRGIGHVLMHHMLADMRSARLRVAWFCWSGDATAARLYEGAGFAVHRRFTILRKEIGA